jgi:YVTN family beta-propeller protein
VSFRRCLLLCLLLLFPAQAAQAKLELIKTIHGKISPKSIVHSGRGLFFAQNMMYRHTITVYSRGLKLIKTISDAVRPARLGYPKLPGMYRGAPVEAAFSPDGKYAYVSNYQMYGKGFHKPGFDTCKAAPKFDRSFLYRVNLKILSIDRLLPTGAVPKYVAVTPAYVLVSNWCGADVSVISRATNKEVRRVKVGAYPRGIAVSRSGQTAYIAIMGGSDIVALNLGNFKARRFKGVGVSPRHLQLDPSGRYLYASLNGEGKIAKIDTHTGKTIKKVATGKQPRSMVIDSAGSFLYVVNYASNTVSKVRARDMKVVQSVKTNHHPIGITYDARSRQVWVANYSGSIQVFQEREGVVAKIAQ